MGEESFRLSDWWGRAGRQTFDQYTATLSAGVRGDAENPL